MFLRFPVLIFFTFMCLQAGGAPKKSKPFIDASFYDGFIEETFPFINSALDMGKSPAGFPKDNYTPRGIFIKLNKGVWACFDKELLRVSAIWSGGDFELNSMAQISYPGTGSKSSKFPAIIGDLQFASGVYPGISLSKTFKDLRKRPLGEMSNTRWLGVQHSGKNAVLKYTVGNQLVLEQISEVEKDVFSRRFELKEYSKPVSFVLFENKELTKLEKLKELYKIKQGTKTVYLSVKGGDLTLSDDKKLIFTASSSLSEVHFSYHKKLKAPGAADISLKPAENIWPQSVTTEFEQSKENTAYVVDKAILPLKNPWRRSLRFADLAFFESGRAAAVTFDGDVWLIDGLNVKSSEIRWKRFASGIYSPLSVKIYKDQIYVFGRDQITRLHDDNNDGMADYYENFSTAFLQAMNTRDFAMDMVIDRQGDFYLSKGGIQNMGGKLANKSFYESPEAGTVVRIFNNGRSSEVFADGLREPFLGYDPLANQIFASDQQGHYVPATPVMEIHKGGFYGHEPSNYRKLKKTVEPSVWIPHSVDNSAAGLTFIAGSKMGPLSKKMLLHSYGQSANFLLYRGEGFGAVSRLPGFIPFPLLKGAVNPVDGQLYMTGFKIYGSSSKDLSGIGRFRYNDKKVNFPIDFKVFQEGIELTFDESTASPELSRLDNYELKRWNYKRSSQYGSGHFSLNGKPGEETLQISKIIINKDSGRVFLLVPGMTGVEQMSLTYNLPEKKSSVYFSISALKPLTAQHFAAKEVKGADLSQAVLVKKLDGKASVKSGEMLLVKNACVACHSLDGSKLGKVGPSFKGLFGSQRSFNDGSSGKADEKYIQESLLDPNRKIVKGYQVAMGSYKGILSDVDIQSIILYLKQLK